jgi:hypothetical protein
VRDDDPRHRTHDDVHRQRRTPIEHPRAGPGDGEAQEQQRIGEVDRDRLGDGPVHAEQHDRACPQQVRASPPGDRADLRILDPREQQEQSENCFDINGDQEKCIDVEIHRAMTEQCVGSHPLRFPSRVDVPPRGKEWMNRAATMEPNTGYGFDNLSGFQGIC